MWGAIAAQTGGALINSVGNKWGTELFGGTTSSQATQNTLKDVNQALDIAAQRAPEFLVATNASCQKGDAARAGYQLAENAFGATAQMTADKARAMQKADSLEQSAEQAMRTAQQQQGRQSANLQEQIVNQAGSAGGSPAALAAIAKAGVSANADSALNLAAQTGQQQAQAMAQAEGMRQQGQQSFMQSMQDEYNRRVTPYMNRFENMSNLGTSLAGQIANSSAQQYGQDVMVNNPLAGLGGAINQIGGGLMQKEMTDDPYAGIFSGFKDMLKDYIGGKTTTELPPQQTTTETPPQQTTTETLPVDTPMPMVQQPTVMAGAPIGDVAGMLPYAGQFGGRAEQPIYRQPPALFGAGINIYGMPQSMWGGVANNRPKYQFGF